MFNIIDKISIYNSDFFLHAFTFGIIFLCAWFFMILFARDKVYALHGKIFGLDDKQVAVCHFILMGLFKIFLILVFLIPYLALVFTRK